MASAMMPLIAPKSRYDLPSASRSSLGPVPVPLVERLVAVAVRAQRESSGSLSNSLGPPYLSGRRPWLDYLTVGVHLAHPGRATAGIRSNERSMFVMEGGDGAAAFNPALSRLSSAICIRIAQNLDLRDRVALSQTIRTFRDALLSEPNLWNRITIPKVTGSTSTANLRCAKNLVSRACFGPKHVMFPIHIRVTENLDSRLEATHIWETLDHFLQISTTINLNFFPVFLDSSQQTVTSQEAALWMLMCQEYPSVERLSLTVPHLTPDGGLIASLPREFLGRNAGQLRSLSLQHVGFQNNVVYPALAQLRAFNYIAGIYNASDHISSSHLQSILANMPKLEYLGLAGFRFVLDPLQPTVRHDYLRYLQIEDIWSGVDDLAFFFQHISKAQYHRSPSSGTALYDLWPQGDLRLALLIGHSHVQPDVTDPAYSFSVRESVAWSPTGPAISSIALPLAHASRIVSLNMHEVQWDVAVHLPALPRLSTLSVVLSTCRYRRQYYSESWWSVIAPPDGVLQWQTALDNLREVRLYSGAERSSYGGAALKCVIPLGYTTAAMGCCCDNGCTISIFDIVDFVRSLKLPRGRLDQLLLSGFDAFVDVEPGLALCELFKWVDAIEGVGEAAPELFRSTSGEARQPLSTTPLAQEMSDIFEGTVVPSILDTFLVPY